MPWRYSYRVLWLGCLQVSRKSPPASSMARQTGWQAYGSSPRYTGRKAAQRLPCRCSQRLTAWRSQSCLAVPSRGRTNSGGSGSDCARPGATTLAASIWWKYSTPPSARLRVEQLSRWTLRERKNSVPSRATSVWPSKRRMGASAPRASRSPTMAWNWASKCSAGTPSNNCRTWLSQGMRSRPNRVCALLRRPRSASARWCARNDGDCMRNTDGAAMPTSAMV